MITIDEMIDSLFREPEKEPPDTRIFLDRWKEEFKYPFIPGTRVKYIHIDGEYTATIIDHTDIDVKKQVTPKMIPTNKVGVLLLLDGETPYRGMFNPYWFSYIGDIELLEEEKPRVGDRVRTYLRKDGSYYYSGRLVSMDSEWIVINIYIGESGYYGDISLSSKEVVARLDKE